MLRQLLTVLAIVTGLAAGAPAQAAPVSDIASVRASERFVAAAEFAAKCTIPSSGPAFAPRAPLLKDGVKTPCPRPRPPIVLPPVMLGADRALE
ncbi:MAG: hypothetical protein J2O44_00560 [Porphyrobacter sp.]|nr:hypothetical protein [Porphyrobacter sp.]